MTDVRDFFYDNEVKRRFELAGERLERFFAQLSEPVRGALPSFASLGLTHPREPVLTAEERSRMADFTNSENYGDRTRVFEFEATNPRTGQRGQVHVSVNSLLLIERSYDDAKTQLQQLLAELTGPNGPLTYDQPASPYDVGALQSTSIIGQWGEARGPITAYGGYGDPRIMSGNWADFPRYGGLQNDGWNVAQTALTYTRTSSSSLLPGLPLPVRWRKIYAKEWLWNAREFSDDAFIATLHRMTELVTLLSRGANANPEWHPAINLFLNGIEPAYHTGGVWTNVDSRFQYKTYHPWARVSRAQPVGYAGLVETGRNDAFWLTSMRTRAPRAQEEHREPLTSNNWGSQDYADAIGNYVQMANLAEFMLNLGASAHINSALEYHRAICTKAYLELNLPVGGGLSAYTLGVQREREARTQRALASQGVGGTGLQLVSGVGDGDVRDVMNTILNGATVASLQLFAANPLIGGIAIGVVAFGVFLTNLILGRAFECNGELVLVRDGMALVRETDEMGCRNRDGDNYGGNQYPHRRKDAIEGRPAIRVRDAYGREL